MDELDARAYELAYRETREPEWPDEAPIDEYRGADDAAYEPPDWPLP